ncbi:MAG: response regulator [Desulfuromonadaceae bacterium]|nr:response regulator [Desulfuromonadaceae bacterium]MDD2856882.1 response regulator [Desulfuromonadaceae bacterium]
MSLPSEWKILVVDDEPMILSIIVELLKNDNCVVETAVDGSAAWEKLNAPNSSFSFVILDRIMPGINGLELLRMIKSDDRLKNLPVIIQSGANSPDQIAEGIEAGAYYYLTKPYVPHTLLSIVRSVMVDIELRMQVTAQAARYIETLKHFTRAELRFSTPEDVNSIAGILSAMCPNPDKVSTGFVELLLNAVEHGNLGITYEEKKQLMYDNRWREELNGRLLSEKYRGRFATVTMERRSDMLKFRILDQGNGFDWGKYLDLDPVRSLDPNGRGIAMARRYSFNTVEFEGHGNIVAATVVL